MRFLVLASDYDGTLATDGVVGPETLAALERLRATGRRLVLVTGRVLDDLFGVFPQVKLFDRIVAENGAVLYRPDDESVGLLSPPPPQTFVEALTRRGVSPLSIGSVILATWRPQETTVLEVIRELGLDLQVVFNKGAVMVLPSGVNKATGLRAALEELGISPHNAVGVGDAENDHAFLAECECAVAVANALPMLKDRSDLVTTMDHGAGVIELVDHLLTNDLGDLGAQLSRHDILLGTHEDGRSVRLPAYGTSLLVAGSSGSGKSTLVTGVLERLADQVYQFCVVDPEGVYESVADAVILGDGQSAPSPEEVLDLLAAPQRNAVVNLLAIQLADRPAFFQALLPRLQELRARTGHPHWIVADDAHHQLPRSWSPVGMTLPQELTGLILLSVHPDQLAPAALAAVDLVLAVGPSREETLRSLAQAVEQRAPAVSLRQLEPGDVLAWERHTAAGAFVLRLPQPCADGRIPV